MAKKICKEFIEVCRAVTADGKLVADEVWFLANWLNDHPAAMKDWPGELFVGPLNNAFADGQLSEDEIEQIALLIAKVEREHSERKSPKEGDAELLTGYQISELRLPSIPFQTEIASSTGQGTYSVSLVDCSCSCPDWIERRGQYPSDSLNRICKHVGAALSDCRSSADLPPWLLGIAQDCASRGRGVFTGDKWALIEIKDVPLIVSYGASDWCNVYAPDEGEYSRFGYNLTERRWAYGESPKGVRTIRKALHELCGV